MRLFQVEINANARTKAGVREFARLTGYDSAVTVTKAFRCRLGVASGTIRNTNAGD